MTVYVITSYHAGDRETRLIKPACKTLDDARERLQAIRDFNKNLPNVRHFGIIAVPSLIVTD